MTADKWVAAYAKLNNSFSKKLIFRIGVDSGYFSNYNNLILAILYCLKHKIKFVLYADHLLFAFQDGWSDFFYLSRLLVTTASIKIITCGLTLLNKVPNPNYRK